MPGIEATENFFRVRLRDPDQFTRLRQIPLKRGKPRIFAVVGRLRGETTTTLQSILFPKEDGWTRDSVQSWMRDHPDVGKAEGDLAEVTQKALAAERVEPWADAGNDDLWEALAKGIPAGGVIRKTYAVQTKQVYEDSHEVDVVASSAAIDRDREVLRPEGMRLAKPKRLPLVASHGYTDLRKQIGEVVRIKADGEEVPARVRYFAEMGNGEADWGWTLVKLGVAAYSVAFKPNPAKIEEADLDDEKVAEQVRAGKKPLRTFHEWEVVELSHVIVPSQRESVQREVAEAVAKGVIEQGFADRIAAALADKAPAAAPPPDKGEDIIAALFGGDLEAAELYDVEVKDARWTAGGARGLPLLDDDSWDGTAAVAAWRRFTGATSAEAMKERATQRRYRRGFVLADPAAPENFASYKFPFAQVDGGRAKASRSGLAAARQVLAGGRNRPDVPAATMQAAERFVNGYLGKPEDDGKGVPVLPVTYTLPLFAADQFGLDRVVVTNEDGETVFQGAPTELVDALERAAGPADGQRRLEIVLPAIEVGTAGLEAWTVKLADVIKAAVAQAAPNAPAIPADSVAHLTRKELAETIVEAAQKIALAEIRKVAGDVDAFVR